MNDRSDNSGHRQRLRARFIKSGADALADYELLELLLFHAIPRRDTKPIARALIKQFGSFAAVLRAPESRLRAIDGIGDSAITALQTVTVAAQRLAREEVMGAPVLGSWDRLLDYLHMSMAHAPIEQLRVLFLNTKNALIADEVQQEGTINHTTAYPREIIKRALELGASAIILVHNHPSGDPNPSDADIVMTKEIRGAGDRLNIALHDHVIIAKGGHTSFKSLGLL